MIDNLNYYRVFLAVAETGSVSRAAEALFISQPAVSKSIHNLEEALSVHLIERSSRGIILTEQGKLLYNQLRPAFDSIRAAEEDLKLVNELGIGELKIGASTSLCRNILLGYLSDFIREYPHIKVSITCHSTHTTIKKLEEGKIDLGLICETTLTDRLSYRPLQEIHDVFVVNPAYLENLYVREQAAERTPDNPWLFAGNVTSLLSSPSPSSEVHIQDNDIEFSADPNTARKSIKSGKRTNVTKEKAEEKDISRKNSGKTLSPELARLLQHLPTSEILERGNLMLLEQGNVTRNHLDHYFFQQNIQPEKVLDVNNMDLLIDFAKIGMGVSSVVKEFAMDALSDGSLVELPLTPPVPPRTVGFCINLQRRRSASMLKFLEAVSFL